MGKFVRHESCPECGSKDNVGVWSDGGKWCFGCHWMTFPQHSDKLSTVRLLFDRANSVNLLGEHVVKLPDDFEYEIPPVAHNWVSQYLTPEDLEKHEVGWSPAMERLIFPLYTRHRKDGSRSLVFWTGRFFGKDSKQPKYYSEGSRQENIHSFGDWNEQGDKPVVFVEDIVSAIVVSKVAVSVPIMGTRIPREWARKLSVDFSEAVVWLDSDKRTESLKQALELSHYFYKGCRTVFTKHDPKTYDKLEIESLLRIDNYHAGPLLSGQMAEA
jgi:hypothetical protein